MASADVPRTVTLAEQEDINGRRASLQVSSIKQEVHDEKRSIPQDFATTTQRSLNLSPSFVISAGTVTFDALAQKVLILYHCPSGEYLLPKGRQNKGETLKECAIRETFEETGYHVSLASHNLTTLAPDSPGEAGLDHGEPIAVQQRITNGVRKVIFWYVAAGLSADEKKMDTQEESECFESMWVDIMEGLETLTWQDDRDIVWQATKAFHDMVSCEAGRPTGGRI